MTELLSARRGATAVVTISHPGRRNALTADMWRRFIPLCDELARDDDVRVVVITGDGEDFSAGSDIRMLTDPDSEGVAAEAEVAIARLPKPVISAIQGYCLGGGCQVALASDLRLATAGARFSIPPANLGIVYPLPGLRNLLQAVGPSQAKRLVFTGEQVDAATAMRIGLVDEIVDGDVVEAALALADRIATRSQLSIHAAKAMLRALASGDDAEAVTQTWLERVADADLPEGQAAFLERREPHFTWMPGRDA